MNTTMQLAIVAAALSEDPRRSPALAQGAGFAGMQFDALAPGLSLPGLSASGRREFRRFLSTHEQQLVGLRVDLGAKGFGPGADVDRLLDQLESVLETAAGMACATVCVDLGPLPAPPRREAPRPRMAPQQAGLIIIPELTATPGAETAVVAVTETLDPSFVAQVDAALVELGRRADRYGVMLAMRSDLAGFAAIARALRAADCPWFGLDLDPVAILRDEWSIDEVFSRLGSLIRHVRARDAQRGADRRTKPAAIGQGSTSWEEILADLDGVGYHGWMTIDPVELPGRTAAALGGMAILRRLRPQRVP